MNADLRQLIEAGLEANGTLKTNWSGAVLAACDGRNALEAFLDKGTLPAKTAADAAAEKQAGTFLTSLAIQGFRGIGPAQTLAVTPGPGLTLVVGRNGSGKSCFAEALEVLFTGDSKRWADRSKVWREGWRNLHHQPATIEADLLLERQGAMRVSATWDAGAPLESKALVVQPKGKAKTTLDALGWSGALVSYRPFLSYNELGSMLDEGPSKLYNALSLVLGLEDLVTAQDALAKARTERKRPGNSPMTSVSRSSRRWSSSWKLATTSGHRRRLKRSPPSRGSSPTSKRCLRAAADPTTRKSTP